VKPACFGGAVAHTEEPPGVTFVSVSCLGWVTFRAARWLCWLTYLAFSLHFVFNREMYFDQYGHLFFKDELVMFGLPIFAVCFGFLELMMRERVGVPRPSLGRDWAPRPAGGSTKLPADSTRPAMRP
jgi:hypothetical protein